MNNTEDFQTLFNQCFPKQKDSYLTNYLNIINTRGIKPISQTQCRSLSKQNLLKHHIIPIPFFKYHKNNLYLDKYYDKNKNNIIYLKPKDILILNTYLYHYFQNNGIYIDVSLYIKEKIRRITEYDNKGIKNNIFNKFLYNPSSYTQEDYNTFTDIMTDRYINKNRYTKRSANTIP